jgi:hypothetical protein
MGNSSTLIFIYENTSGNQISDLLPINYEFEKADKILDSLSVDPPEYLVNRLIDFAKTI